jgi:hypothetical protein
MFTQLKFLIFGSVVLSAVYECFLASDSTLAFKTFAYTYFSHLKSQNTPTDRARQSFDAFQIRRGVVHKKGCYS